MPKNKQTDRQKKENAAPANGSLQRSWTNAKVKSVSDVSRKSFSSLTIPPTTMPSRRNVSSLSGGSIALLIEEDGQRLWPIIITRRYFDTSSVDYFKLPIPEIPITSDHKRKVGRCRLTQVKPFSLEAIGGSQYSQNFDLKAAIEQARLGAHNLRDKLLQYRTKKSQLEAKQKALIEKVVKSFENGAAMLGSEPDISAGDSEDEADFWHSTDVAFSDDSRKIMAARDKEIDDLVSIVNGPDCQKHLLGILNGDIACERHANFNPSARKCGAVLCGPLEDDDVRLQELITGLCNWLQSSYSNGTLELNQPWQCENYVLAVSLPEAVKFALRSLHNFSDETAESALVAVDEYRLTIEERTALTDDLTGKKRRSNNGDNDRTINNGSIDTGRKGLPEGRTAKTPVDRSKPSTSGTSTANGKTSGTSTANGKSKPKEETAAPMIPVKNWPGGKNVTVRNAKPAKQIQLTVAGTVMKEGSESAASQEKRVAKRKAERERQLSQAMASHGKEADAVYFQMFNEHVEQQQQQARKGNK